VADGPSVEQDIWQYYQSHDPGQVQVLGPDVLDGSPSQLQTFKDGTGATYPLLLKCASPPDTNFAALYGPRDNYVVVNKQGIVSYHAALRWPYGNGYHLDEIRGCVDSLVSSPVDVAEPGDGRGFRLTAAPNPLRGSARIELTCPPAGAARARITVFDLAGREVARLWDGAVSGGVTQVMWEGRSADGASAAAGLYVIRAEVGPVRLVRRVVLLR
jgi:flagellar hook capping protein FlgD